jgi:hypothetical protein
MNSLEQYLKPPTNNQEEEFYNEDGEGAEEENDYIQNQENGNDNGDNQDVQGQLDDNIKDANKLNILENNIQYDDDDIIQGINSINTIENKNINNQKNDENDVINNVENDKKEFEYIKNNFLNINDNENVDINSPDELMNELLNKIRRIKESRAKPNNIFENDKNKGNNNNNRDSLLNIGLEKSKSKKIKNEYLGKLNINNQLIQNNPKMKELANLLKEYNRDKNENDKIQINFYNNNQINIVKPEVFFNNNNSRNKNINYYDKNYENKHYISVIDGKAIINGQRINVNSGLYTTAKNNFKDKKINFNEIKKNKIFDFNNDKFPEKRWSKDNNLDFKLNNFNNLNNEINFKINNSNDNKNRLSKVSKTSFLTKDYYNEELSKINDSLFNIDNFQNKLRK